MQTDPFLVKHKDCISEKFETVDNRVKSINACSEISTNENALFVNPNNSSIIFFNLFYN